MFLKNADAIISTRRLIVNYNIIIPNTYKFEREKGISTARLCKNTNLINWNGHDIARHSSTHVRFRAAHCERKSCNVDIGCVEVN